MKTATNYFGTPLIIGIRTKLYSNDILFFEGDVNYARIHFKSGKQRIIARTHLYIQNRTRKFHPYQPKIFGQSQIYCGNKARLRNAF